MLVIASLNSFHCSIYVGRYCSSYTRNYNLPDMHNCACAVHTLHALRAAQFQNVSHNTLTVELNF